MSNEAPQTRHIWVIRHGKSTATQSGRRDHERVLNKRGERDGQAMRTWFAAQANPAQWVWSSSAVRAKLTASYVTAGFGATFVEDASLYLASAETAMATLKATPSDVGSVALVAHNPGLTYLVNMLSTEPITDNLVTFGTTLFKFNGEWSDLAARTAEFISLTTPKNVGSE